MGNLPPGSKAALTLKYVQEMPLEADGALRYVLPAILNPRYQLSGDYSFPLSTTGGWIIEETPSKYRVLKSVGKENRTKVTFCRWT